jgi:hypothetical protein
MIANHKFEATDVAAGAKIRLHHFPVFVGSLAMTYSKSDNHGNGIFRSFI